MEHRQHLIHISNTEYRVRKALVYLVCAVYYCCKYLLVITVIAALLFAAHAVPELMVNLLF